MGTATVKGTITLSGTDEAAPLDGTADYTETVSSDVNGGNACADFATHGDPSGDDSAFRLAPPSVTVAGDDITVGGGVHGLGPGEFHNDASAAFTGFSVQDVNEAFDYEDPGTGTFDLVVNADGSGKLTFAGLEDQNGASGTLGGSVTWTCG